MFGNYYLSLCRDNLWKNLDFSSNKLRLSGLSSKWLKHFAVASRVYFSCLPTISRITFRVWPPHGARYVSACGDLRRRSVCNFRRCAFTARPLHPRSTVELLNQLTKLCSLGLLRTFLSSTTFFIHESRETRHLL